MAEDLTTMTANVRWGADGNVETVSVQNEDPDTVWQYTGTEPAYFDATFDDLGQGGDVLVLYVNGQPVDWSFDTLDSSDRHRYRAEDVRVEEGNIVEVRATTVVDAPGAATYSFTDIYSGSLPTLTGVTDAPVTVTAGVPSDVGTLTVGNFETNETITVTLVASGGTVMASDEDPNMAGVQIIGTVAEVNAVFAPLQFRADAAGTASIDVVVSDGHVSVHNTINVTVEANVLPAITVPGSPAQVVTGQASALPDFTITDANDDHLIVLLSPTNGTISGVTDDGGGAYGANVIMLQGTPAAINARLADAEFTATADGTASIQITTTDYNEEEAVVVGTLSITAQASGVVTPPQGGGGGGGGAGPTTPHAVTGTDGSDTLGGTATDDTIYARAGDDEIRAGAGNDRAFGGAGNDTVFGAAGDDTLGGGAGNDYVGGGAGFDLGYGGTGNDTLLGGTGDDTLYGGADADQVFGGEDQDKVFGGAGDDTVYGGNGDDTLWGGTGNDMLVGGADADVFAFIAGSGDDRVLDFDGAEGDRLDLHGQTYTQSIDANGDVTLTLSGGGNIVLVGVQQFDGEWFL